MNTRHPFDISLEINTIVRYFRPFFLTILAIVLLSNCSKQPENAIETNNVPDIFPEYYDLVLPPNIAPLNFIIEVPGSKYRLEISAQNGKTISLKQKSPDIKIPLKRWQRLLSENKGDTIKFEIWAFDNHVWTKYKNINHLVSSNPIDPYLAYRIVNAVYLKWRDMGIYQRNLTNFEESPLIENSSTENGCMNCHSFSKNDPSKMLIHFRILHAGTLIWNEGELSKIDTRTGNTMSSGIYPAWHPDGKHIAFAVGQISPHLTTRSSKVVDVADKASDLIVYNLENNEIITSPKISTKRRENMPVWSADGKYLYFISAPEALKGDDESLLHSKYDLMRIAYDTELNIWGEVEMILSSDITGKSISMPSVSPNGNYIVCSMSDYGYFTIYHKDSDLYSVNLDTKEYKKLELNSGSTDSYSTWSSNGKWLIFSSKRMDDVYTRPYIAYFDEDGISHTPFVLPQKDPDMYNRLLGNYNRPELITGKIELSPIEIRDVVFGEAENVENDISKH